MNINDLDKIQRVDPPSYLYSKIQLRIDESTSPIGLRWAIAASFLFVVALNVGALVKLSDNSQSNSITSLARTLQITQSNSLYP
jgi:hypothetical protein